MLVLEESDLMLEREKRDTLTVSVLADEGEADMAGGAVIEPADYAVGLGRLSAT